MCQSRFFCVPVLVFVGSLTAACSDAPSSPTSASSIQAPPEASQRSGVNGTMSAPAPAPSAAQYELRFMMDMIAHHQMAIEMAELCVQKAVHEGLRQMCQSIIDAQSQEIAAMQQWLKDWYGITYEPRMTPGDQQMLNRLASLSGAEFEITFMEMMIRHHERAIKEAEQCVRKAYHAELIGMCHDIIATQSAEIAQLESWLCQWYGRC